MVRHRIQARRTGGWEADVEGIESAIASQAQIAVQLSDAVILVVDGHVGLTDTDERIVKMLRASGKPVTLAVNKVDDGASEYLTAEFWKLGMGEPYGISAMHGEGSRDLLDAALDSLRKADKTSGFLTPTHLRRVALVGRPNVGKSSLLNQLAGEQRAVVTTSPARPATRSTRPSTSTARTGCSSTPPASSVDCTRCPVPTTTRPCARRPQSSVPSSRWSCSTRPSPSPTRI